MPAIRTAHIISHTHWDREWYLNSPYTNPWLAPFFEALFAMLDKEPGDYLTGGAYRFVLDGQTAMIEDWCEQLAAQGKDPAPYLERLSVYVRQGRVCAGPYYLQPDWQLVSEEALVRNLLIGQQMANQLAVGQSVGRMPVGWLLDNFGQISQTAQIHRQFGLAGLYVWRGVAMDPNGIRSEFTWESPDGSTVTAIYLVGSYRNGMRLAEYADSMAGRIQGEIKKLAPFASTPNILLMNGYDQEMQPDDILPQLRAGLSRVGGVEVRQSTPAEYLQAVLDGLDPARPLPVLRGALYSGRYISVFPGILSSRMYIKLQNDAGQKLLEHAAEPLASLLHGLGQPYPAADLDRAWRLLLKNHPHDSVCGVSIDDVHTDMEARFRQSADIAGRLAHTALETLAANVDTRSPSGTLARWVVVNTCPRPVEGLVEISAGLPGPLHFVDSTGHPLQAQPSGRGAAGRCSAAVLNSAYTYPDRAAPSTGPQPNQITELPPAPSPQADPGSTSILVYLPAIPALGYQTIYALPGDLPTSSSSVPNHWLRVDPAARTIENAWMRLTVHPDGSLNLFDKLNDHGYTQLGIFEDDGDAGDTYNYSYPALDRVITSQGRAADITWLETGPLRARLCIRLDLEIPTALTADRTERSPQTCRLPITTLLTVEAHSPLVKFHTTVANTARDHRLRVRFPTGLQTTVSNAETQFDVVTRPIQPADYDDTTIPEHVRQVILGAREPKPVTIFPQRAFVDLDDGQCGLAVLNQGLPEYEILPEANTIALTLFRGVGWLARPDLLTRTGDAGPLIATPGAQCLRVMAFDYAVLAHAGDWQRGQVLSQAEAFNRRLVVVETGSHPGSLPPQNAFLWLNDPSGQLKVTAIKRAEDDQALILRLHNPTGQGLSAWLESGFTLRRAWAANLNEAPAEPLALVDAHRLPIHAAAKKILTLRLEIEPQRLDLLPPGPNTAWIEPAADPLDEPPLLELAAVALPDAITPDDIAEEERRAAALDARLAEQERALQDAALAGGRGEPEGLAQYQLRLEAATTRRALLEARLSATLLKKNSGQAQETETGTLSQFEITLRQIGDAINTARVEKRALEYVVDYYTKQANDGNNASPDRSTRASDHPVR